MLENAIEESNLIDLTVFDTFPDYANDEVYPWDIIGILAAFPDVRRLGDGDFLWKIKIFQTENRSVNIEFKTSSSAEEPKFCRIADPVGKIVYIRHITMWSKGNAGLYAPFGKTQFQKQHFNYRTILVLDFTAEEMEKFEQVKFLPRFVNKLASRATKCASE